MSSDVFIYPDEGGRRIWRFRTVESLPRFSFLRASPSVAAPETLHGSDLKRAPPKPRNIGGNSSLAPAPLFAGTFPRVDARDSTGFFWDDGIRRRDNDLREFSCLHERCSTGMEIDSQHPSRVRWFRDCYRRVCLFIETLDQYSRLLRCSKSRPKILHANFFGELVY